MTTIQIVECVIILVFSLGFVYLITTVLNKIDGVK